MSKQSDRDAFVASMTREGMPLDVIRALLRAETTLHRLAELECSSEAADRDRVPCPGKGKGGDSCLCRDYGSYDDDACSVCGAGFLALSGNTRGCAVHGLREPGWHGDVPRIAVQGARIEARVLKLVSALPGFGVKFNGDPRGPAILVTVPSGRTDDWGQRGICVP